MATNSLGRLTLDLVVQTASFSEPLSKAERQARASSQGIANSLNIAAIAVSALGGAVSGLSVAQLVNFSDQVIQTGNDIQKFSKLANASVREFQYYAKGAETAGISLESFADKMKDMQDRIGDFQQTGGGPLADFFTNIAPKVGVTIQQFQKLSFQAYNQILASPWYLDVISKQTAATLVLGMGMANVGMIAGQTIAGMAHNGIDNIPREGTWLLDGGERVLNPQQNKDLTNYLNNRQNGSSEGNVQISQQITFADGSASVNTQGQKQIAESLNNAMDAWARRESRQGGVLFNLVRR
ncbi:hypothetical protein A1E80_RS18740 [Acinetobacter baumannii]|nr:hypothetical protein [Acinetobacter baumannii]EHU1749017.1 hypothetical protein [Acinetobacter baumannii]EHU1801089.1 hypothetical protein [Acinetobacter baumannii]EHU1953654.1 hypothetical protein [Acinetobacter baumannii]